jgi:hypothetical protein
LMQVQMTLRYVISFHFKRQLMAYLFFPNSIY